MTQISRPTGQHITNYPNGDSGPYSSVQWRDIFKTMFTTDDNQGPVGDYLDELEVSNPAGRTIRVASGAAIVGGNVFFNDSDVDFSVAVPAAATRNDYVVVCLNDTDTVMTLSDSGRTLGFPSVLTDYNSASSIQEYACRLAILQGAEGGGLPTLDQNDDHYMIPLASWSITTGGAIANFSDAREFCEYPLDYRSTKGFLVPPVGGYWQTNADDKYVGGYTSEYGFTTMGAQDQADLWGAFSVPDDFVSDLTVTLLVNSSSLVRDYRFRMTANYGQIGELYDTHSETWGYETWTDTEPNGTIVEVHTLDLTDAEAEDIVMLKANRDCDHADDDGAIMQIIGWWVEYTASRIK